MDWVITSDNYSVLLMLLEESVSSPNRLFKYYAANEVISLFSILRVIICWSYLKDKREHLMLSIYFFVILLLLWL